MIVKRAPVKIVLLILGEYIIMLHEKIAASLAWYEKQNENFVNAKDEGKNKDESCEIEVEDQDCENARDGIPGSILGFPVVVVDDLPTFKEGDLVLGEL